MYLSIEYHNLGQEQVDHIDPRLLNTGRSSEPPAEISSEATTENALLVHYTPYSSPLELFLIQSFYKHVLLQSSRVYLSGMHKKAGSCPPYEDQAFKNLYTLPMPSLRQGIQPKG